MADIKQVVTVPQLKTLLTALKSKFAMSVNGNKPDANGKVTLPTFTGASASAGGTSGLVPAPATGKQSTVLKGDGTWGDLSVFTGATTALDGKEGLVPQPTKGKQDNALLASGTFGTLPIAGGGTGATEKIAACKNLGLEWDFMHRYDLNYVPSDVTNNGWNSLGICLIRYNVLNKIKNQPTQYGQLLNIPFDTGNESTQVWIDQDSSRLYCRKGNAQAAVNNNAFNAFAFLSEVTAANTGGIVAANMGANGYVKFANGLIVQWGVQSLSGYDKTFSFPLTFNTLLFVDVLAYDSCETFITSASTSNVKFRLCNGYNDDVWSGAYTCHMFAVGK